MEFKRSAVWSRISPTRLEVVRFQAFRTEKRQFFTNRNMAVTEHHLTMTRPQLQNIQMDSVDVKVSTCWRLKWRPAIGYPPWSREYYIAFWGCKINSGCQGIRYLFWLHLVFRAYLGGNIKISGTVFCAYFSCSLAYSTRISPISPA